MYRAADLFQNTGVSGASIGYGLAHASVNSSSAKVPAPFNANTIGQIGALAGLQDTEHQERTRRVTFEGRRDAYFGKRLVLAALELSLCEQSLSKIQRPSQTGLGKHCASLGELLQAGCLSPSA